VSELTTRIVLALFGIPLTLGLIYAGGWIFVAALGGIAGLAAWELFRMARNGGSEPLATAGIVLAASIPLLVHASYLGVFTITLTNVVVIFMMLLASVIWARGISRKPFVSLGVTVAGVIYASLVSYMYPLRYHSYAVGALAGTVVAMFPIVLTWATDTGAYAVGRLTGKTKLIPSVSPSKTVEGAIGGLVAASIVAWIYVQVFLQPMAQLSILPLGIVAFALLIAVVAQVGDLVESLLKRDAGVKDSSAMLPGHGGILDRFDSLLFVLPVSYMVLGYLLVPSPR